MLFRKNVLTDFKRFYLIGLQLILRALQISTYDRSIRPSLEKNAKTSGQTVFISEDKKKT